MDLLAKARQLETRIARTLDEAVEGFVGRSTRQPVEIVQAVLESAERQIQHAGRGRRVFPFNHVAVHVLAPSRADQARFTAVIDGPPSLTERLNERLTSTGCHVDRLDVQVSFTSQAEPGWVAPEHHIVFDRVEEMPTVEAPPSVAPAVPRIELSVISGSAQRPTFAFDGERIDLGRRAEVLDHRQHLIRINHVAFTEGENDVNRTVSRRHAHIGYSPASREYRVHDDGSSRGTAVLRNGQTIRVPQGSRGIRLESGDEIALGEARLKVQIR